MATGLGFLTLRKRIVIVFTCAILLPFLLTVAVSNATISSIQTNQIQSRIQANLTEVRVNIENSLDNLNHVSQQLALEGSVGTLLAQYLSTTDGFDRANLRDKIRTELSLVSYTNPNVGLMMYTFNNGQRTDFESAPNLIPFRPQDLPLLASHYQISYFGPHKSHDKINGSTVLSVLRKVDTPDFQDISIYLETGFHLADTILDGGEAKARYLFLDGTRKTVYTGVPATFPLGRTYGTNGQSWAVRSGYLWNEIASPQGWTLVSLVKESEYNRERDRWLGLILVLFLLFLVIGVLVGSLLWSMVYRPLGVFQKEMTWIENLDHESHVVPVNIPEFDRLLFQFHDMKGKILQLIEDGKTKERVRADLEIEKLLHQINPHFLLNALNTVHWLAVVHQQPEIDRFSLSLTKLLAYNLGKLGKLGTIRSEIEALQEYVAIQSLRFDLKFTTTILVDDAVLDTPIPRFTLQPLVENAIYHGLGDDGWIELEIKEHQGLRLSVQDHGPGMTTSGEQPFGMGIGLAYVNRILDVHFEGRARLEIFSSPTTGTRITVVLPPQGSR